MRLVPGKRRYSRSTADRRQVYGRNIDRPASPLNNTVDIVWYEVQLRSRNYRVSLVREVDIHIHEQEPIVTADVRVYNHFGRFVVGVVSDPLAFSLNARNTAGENGRTGGDKTESGSDHCFALVGRRVFRPIIA